MKLLATFFIILIIINFIKDLFQKKIKKIKDKTASDSNDIIDIDYEEIE